jgi:transcriptional regulator with XRE-family HTH domain
MSEQNLNLRIGKRFKDLRSQVGLDQQHICQILCIPRSAISLIESGQRELTLYEFDLLCRLFRISPNEVLGWNRSKAKETVIREMIGGE